MRRHCGPPHCVLPTRTMPPERVRVQRGQVRGANMAAEGVWALVPWCGLGEEERGDAREHLYAFPASAGEELGEGRAKSLSGFDGCLPARPPRSWGSAFEGGGWGWGRH